MEDPYRERTSLARGARDIAKEAKRHAAKKVNKVIDRTSDEFSGRSYSRFENDEEDNEDRYHYQDGQVGTPLLLGWCYVSIMDNSDRPFTVWYLDRELFLATD